MSDDALVKAHIENGMAILTLNRPERRNALNRAMLSELGANLAMLSGRKDLRAVLIRGEGKAFAAGADISEMKALGSAEAMNVARMAQRIFTAFEHLSQPTIALVHGFALGGGLELALACDIRIAAEDARLGQPEVSLGIIPGFGGTQRLPRIIGQGRAMHMLLTGNPIDAETALQYGLVTDVVSEDALLDAGMDLVETLRQRGPVALSYVKQAVYDGTEIDLSKAQSMEASLFGLSFSTEDKVEGVNAFLEKRSPSFQGK